MTAQSSLWDYMVRQKKNLVYTAAMTGFLASFRVILVLETYTDDLPYLELVNDCSIVLQKSELCEA